jgi:hypothetical protein
VEWTNEELFQALERFGAECEAAGLADLTVHSYVNYARMFVRWRTGDFHTHGGEDSEETPRLGPADVPQLEADLDAYGAYLQRAGRKPAAVQTYVSSARQFVYSLDGRFAPRASKRSRPGETIRRGRPDTPTRGPRPIVKWVPDLPSDDDVLAKRSIYAAEEPRDLAYRVARFLIDHDRSDRSDFSAGDGVALLLMSWNDAFFRFRPGPVRTLAADLDRLILRHQDQLEELKVRSIVSYVEAVERAALETLYRQFLALLWPVGTAKAMHVLAPGFFPIWDTAIARAFRLPLSPPELSVNSYFGLMRIAQRFAARSGLPDPLKALGEWAYVTFTLRR